MGLISGRKEFNKSVSEDIELLHAIQDIYLYDEKSIALFFAELVTPLL